MKITVDNVCQLNTQARIDLLKRIIEGAIKLDEINDEDQLAVLSILQGVINYLDSEDEDDAYGTEGWRHSILGED